MKQDEYRPETKAVRGGTELSKKNAPLSTPIYQTSTFQVTDSDQQLRATHTDMFYTRYGNPTHTVAEKAIADLPDALAALKLHYLRWVLFDIGKDTYFMYQGIFDTDFDKYTEDAVALFTKYGVNTVFENLEGFPEDWKTNVPAFVEFVREHQCPSFLEYGEYPYATADEIKKALKLKAAFADMLNLMQ